jgi:hypothetical protein
MHPDRKKEPMTRRRPNRRGYALMLVILFVVLFSAILGVAWRRVASALRVEHLSEVRKQCDGGSVQVLAGAMKVLETCVRRNASGNITLDGSTDSPRYYKKDIGDGKLYKIVFTRTTPLSQLPTEWSVSVTVKNNADPEVQGYDVLPGNPP